VIEAGPRGRTAARLRPGLLGFVLSLAMCVGLLTGFVIGVLAPFITTDLQLGPAAVGRLSAVLFAVGALASRWAGSLVDRFRGRSLLILLFASTGIAWLVMAAASSFGFLVAAMAIAGVGMALANPLTTRLALRDDNDSVGLVGVAQSGSPIGAFLVGTLVPPAAAVFGWRGAVLGMCALCLVGLAVAPRVASQRPAPSVRADDGPGPRAYWLPAYAFLMNVCANTVVVYLPLYAFDDLGWSAGTAGLITAAGGVSSIAGRMLWPRALHGRSNVPPTMAALSATAAVCTLLVLLTGPLDSSALLWLGVVGFAASGNAWVALIMSAVTLETEERFAGRLAGRIMQFGFLGAATGPALFGYAVEATGSYSLGWASTLVVYLTAAAGSALWHLRRRGDPAPRSPRPG
jgi:cyanate permease